MIRLVYSNRTEELVRELAARVRTQQLQAGPLVPVPIVVPGAAMESAVRLGIAREQGIAANLEVQLLTRFAASVAAPEGARIADANAIQAMVLELVLDDARDEAQRWLAGAGAVKVDAAALSLEDIFLLAA